MLKKQSVLHRKLRKSIFSNLNNLRVPTVLGFEQINVGNSIFYDTVSFETVWKLNNIRRETNDWSLVRRILLKCILPS